MHFQYHHILLRSNIVGTAGEAIGRFLLPVSGTPHAVLDENSLFDPSLPLPRAGEVIFDFRKPRIVKQIHWVRTHASLVGYWSEEGSWCPTMIWCISGAGSTGGRQGQQFLLARDNQTATPS